MGFLVCVVSDCSKPHKARGYCNTHYARMKRRGTVDDAVGRPKTHKERFERIGWKETSEGCYEWLGYVTPDGYGSFRYEGNMVNAHRASYILYVEDFDRELVVRHTCDNPRCVNPQHLELGTPKDNVYDCINRSRRHTQKAEDNSNSKLDWDKVREIKHLWKTTNTTQQQLADTFGVSQVLVSKLIRNVLWKEE